LLLGEQVDSNSAYIARRLREIGLSLSFKTIVGDDEPRMVEALRIALSRSDVILVGGGLGPTVDDVTRRAVARATDRELVFSEELLEQIKARFQTFGVKMSENNRQQAYIPQDALPIENPVGTAPAFAVEHQGKVIICLPGVPREMMYLMDNAVLPFLRTRFNLSDVMLVRTLHTAGEGESRLDAAIADLETSTNPIIGVSAKPGQIDIRISAQAHSIDDARVLIQAMEVKIRERIGKWIYGADDETLEGLIGRLLFERKQTLSTIEVNNGGAIGSRLTLRQSIDDAQAAMLERSYRGGLVVVGVDALRAALHIDADTAHDYMPLVTRAAQEARRVYGSTLGLAVLLDFVKIGNRTGSTFYTALVSDSDTKTYTRNYGGHFQLAAAWSAALSLRMVWTALQEPGA
jgi:competence/damage-inducible protein CinA-like protein